MDAAGGSDERWTREELRERIFDCEYEMAVLGRLNLGALGELLLPGPADRAGYSLAAAGNFAAQVGRLWEAGGGVVRLLCPAPLETMVGCGAARSAGLFFPDSVCDALEPADDVVLLNPALAVYLLTNDRLLRSLSRKVRGRLVFFLDHRPDDGTPASRDTLVRRHLHRNGFFEVDTLLCAGKERPLQMLATSRYLHAEADFYWLREPAGAAVGGLVVYAAGRKGRLA